MLDANKLQLQISELGFSRLADECVRKCGSDTVETLFQNCEKGVMFDRRDVKDFIDELRKLGWNIRGYIEELELPVGTLWKLKRHGVCFIEGLEKMHEETLLSLIGRKGLETVRKELTHYKQVNLGCDDKKEQNISSTNTSRNILMVKQVEIDMEQKKISLSFEFSNSFSGYDFIFDHCELKNSNGDSIGSNTLQSKSLGNAKSLSRTIFLDDSEDLSSMDRLLCRLVEFSRLEYCDVTFKYCDGEFIPNNVILSRYSNEDYRKLFEKCHELEATNEKLKNDISWKDRKIEKLQNEIISLKEDNNVLKDSNCILENKNVYLQRQNSRLQSDIRVYKGKTEEYDYTQTKAFSDAIKASEKSIYSTE